MCGWTCLQWTGNGALSQAMSTSLLILIITFYVGIKIAGLLSVFVIWFSLKFQHRLRIRKVNTLLDALTEKVLLKVAVKKLMPDNWTLFVNIH